MVFLWNSIPSFCDDLFKLCFSSETCLSPPETSAFVTLFFVWFFIFLGNKYSKLTVTQHDDEITWKIKIIKLCKAVRIKNDAFIDEDK